MSMLQPVKSSKSRGKTSGKSGRKSSGKSSGKKIKKSASSKGKSSAKVKGEVDVPREVDMLDPSAMYNLYYIAHGITDAMEIRGFGWPGNVGKKKGGKKKGRKKKWRETSIMPICIPHKCQTEWSSL